MNPQHVPIEAETDDVPLATLESGAVRTYLERQFESALIQERDRQERTFNEQHERQLREAVLPLLMQDVMPKARIINGVPVLPASPDFSQWVQQRAQELVEVHISILFIEVERKAEEAA